MPIFPDLFSGLRLALRARFLTLALWLGIAIIALTWMAAQFSGRQPATVALDVGLSVIRLFLPLVIVLLVQELFSREFDRRHFLTSLTYPRPRHRFFLGRLAAAATLVLALLAAAGLLLAGLAWWIGQGYAQGTPVALGGHYLATLGFLAIDLFVATAVAAFLAVVAVTPSFVLIGTFGFLIAARSYSGIVALLSENPHVVGDGERYRSSLELLGYLLPDLGALDIRMTALYGSWSFLPANWPVLLAGAVAYGLAFLALAVWALQRKRFS